MKITKALILSCAFLALSFHRLQADTPIFFESFENLISPSALDANYPGGSNIGPNGGPGNPWWGEFPPDLRVTQAETQILAGGITNNVVPHSGTNMVSGSGNGFDKNFMNIAYRVNHSNIYSGNVTLDWWFYDPAGTNATQLGNYRDYVSLAFFDNLPTNTDYLTNTSDEAVAGNPVTRLSIGASDLQSVGFQATNYQAQIQGTTATNAYDTSFLGGWFNLPVVRSIGWHHAKIAVAPALTNGTANVSFYLDDMTNAVLTNNSASSFGFNCIFLGAELGTSLSGYYDDISVTVPPPPALSITVAGTNAIVGWPGSGWTLQTSTNLGGTNFVDVPGATSPYTNAVTNFQSYFRLRQ